MKPRKVKLVDGIPVLLSRQGEKAELHCNSCKGSLWPNDKLTVAIKPEETDQQLATRLRLCWGEANGGGDIRCETCRGELSLEDRCNAFTEGK